MKQLFWQRDGVFEPETHVETYTTGIKWIFIISNLLSVQHMHFTECNIIQNPDLAPAFFAAIEQNRGFVWIFSTSRDAKLEKLDGEAATTLRSIGFSTKPFSSELTLARPYAMRTGAQPPTSTTSIPDVDSAREDLPNDTHVITFQRKLYDSFTK